MLLTCSANLFAGLLLALGLIGMGLPIPGAFIFGFTIAFAGIFFTGIGALCAQLRVNAGNAKGMAFIGIGAGLLLLILNNGGVGTQVGRGLCLWHGIGLHSPLQAIMAGYSSISWQG